MQFGVIESEDQSFLWTAGRLYVLRPPQVADHRHMGIVAMGDGFQDRLDVVQFNGGANLQHDALPRPSYYVFSPPSSPEPARQFLCQIPPKRRFCAGGWSAAVWYATPDRKESARQCRFRAATVVAPQRRHSA